MRVIVWFQRLILNTSLLLYMGYIHDTFVNQAPLFTAKKQQIAVDVTDHS